MDEKMRQQLIEAGIDIDDLMNRLMGKTDMIQRFIRRFPADESFNLLQRNLDEGNCEDAFRTCHTLKGLCANLSMKEMWNVISQQVEMLRAGEIEKAKEIMPKISEMYRKMIDDIERIFP